MQEINVQDVFYRAVLCEKDLKKEGDSIKISTSHFSKCGFIDEARTIKSKGLSADRKAERTEEEVYNAIYKEISNGKEGVYAFVLISFLNLQFDGPDGQVPPAEIIYKEKKCNKYHYEIYQKYDRNPQKCMKLTKSQKKRLVDSVVLKMRDENED